MSFICNGLIFAVTLVLAVRMFRKDGGWCVAKGLHLLRYFTVQSNLFCAFAALCLCLFPGSGWAWALKYIGTAAVTVTMLTVLFFLGPTMGYGKMLSGSDLFMHLLTPLAAILSFCLWERRGLSLPLALTGVLPVVIYGLFYAWKILLAPQAQRWEDFYGFNRGGRWYLSMAAMFAGAFVVCLVLRAAQNL